MSEQKDKQFEIWDGKSPIYWADGERWCDSVEAIAELAEDFDPKDFSISEAHQYEWHPAGPVYYKCLRDLDEILEQFEENSDVEFGDYWERSPIPDNVRAAYEQFQAALGTYMMMDNVSDLKRFVKFTPEQMAELAEYEAERDKYSKEIEADRDIEWRMM